MAVFTWKVSYGTSKEKKYRVKRVVFGEGYESRRSDGFNVKSESWDIVMRGEKATVEAAEAFLDARGCIEAFDWNPDGRATAIRVVALPGYKVTYPEYGKADLSATFYQVFEP